MSRSEMSPSETSQLEHSEMGPSGTSNTPRKSAHAEKVRHIYSILDSMLSSVQTKQRDRNHCLLTNVGTDVQACHIYPYSGMKEDGPIGF